MTLGITDTQHKNTSGFMLYAECCNFCIDILNVIMLSVIMLNVLAPFILRHRANHFFFRNEITEIKIKSVFIIKKKENLTLLKT